jgi:hypothetical protein
MEGVKSEEVKTEGLKSEVGEDAGGAVASTKSEGQEVGVKEEKVSPVRLSPPVKMEKTEKTEVAQVKTERTETVQVKTEKTEVKRATTIFLSDDDEDDEL